MLRCALYEQRYYPQAVFFLQQGVEKGWKAFGYRNGTVTLEEARNTNAVGHKGARVGKMALLKLRDIIGPMIRQVKMARGCINIPQTGDPTGIISYLENLDADLHWAQKEIDKVIVPHTPHPWRPRKETGTVPHRGAE